MNILVTDGNTRAALAITRSLGKKGHAVFVGDSRSSSLASCSKYCHEPVTYPDSHTDSAGFIAALQKLVERHRIDLVIPVTDVCVLPVSEHRSCFSDRVRIPLPRHEALLLAANKSGLIETAASLGVAIPHSIVVPAKGATVDIQGLHFPVVIKPSRSRIPTDMGWLSTGVDYAMSTSELVAKLSDINEPAYPILVQERIIGPGIGLFYCYDNGKCIASFAHRRLREKPPSGGVSVMRESVVAHPGANRFGQMLLDHLGWHGVAMVEFKLDQRDQTPKLMEINGRFWGSLQLAIDSGMDFPALLAAIALNEDPTPKVDYRVGIRSRWLLGELDLLMMFLFKSNAELKLPQGHSSRLRSVLEILNPFYRKQRLEVLRLSDPKPWLHEVAEWPSN